MRSLAVILCLASIAFAAEKPEPKPVQVTYRLYGLFSPDREKDLRSVWDDVNDVKLVGLSYEDAEITVEYTPGKAFGGASKPEQFQQQIDNRIRQATHSTFAIGPRRTIAKDKLKEVVVPIAGLDCKACCLAAYEAVARIDGVDRVTASFKEGKLTALIDPEKMDKAKLEDALKKRNIHVGK